MKKLILLLLLCVSAFAQQNQCPTNATAYQNDPSTGTTLNTLTKLNSSGNAVIMATTDTSGYVGVAISGAGTKGTVCLATVGLVAIIMDGTSTAQHYVQISSTIGGDGKDTGASALPTSGGDIIGRVQSASTGGGGVSVVSLFPPEIQAVNASGAGVTGPGTSVVGDIAGWNSTVGAVLLDSGANVVNGAVHGVNTFFSTAYSTASVTPSTVTGLTSPSIAANSTVAFQCVGLWSTGTATGQNLMQVNASQTPVAIWYIFNNYRSATTNNSLVSTTNATLLNGGANAIANNIEAWYINGVIQWNASNPGTFSIQAATNNVANTLSVPANAQCTVMP